MCDFDEYKKRDVGGNMEHAGTKKAVAKTGEATAKDCPVLLLVASKEAGNEAVSLLQKAGIFPTVVGVRSEPGEASVELISDTGNFDGLNRIIDYIEIVGRERRL
jgi:hypothetical protein